MADVLKNQTFISTGTGNSDTHLVVPNSSSTKTVLSIVMCNVDTDDCEFDLYMAGDPEGATNGNDNYRVYNQQSLPAGATFIHNSKVVVTNGLALTFIQRQSTAAATIHVTTSYLDQT